MDPSEGMWCKGTSWPEEKVKRNVPVSPPSVYHPDISCAIPMSAPSCHRSNTSQCASDGGDESAATREEEEEATWKRHKSGGKEGTQPKRVMWQRLRVRFLFYFMSSVTNEKVRSVGKAESAAEMEMCGRKRENDTVIWIQKTPKVLISALTIHPSYKEKVHFCFFCASCTSQHWWITSSGSTDVKTPDCFKIKLYYHCL